MRDAAFPEPVAAALVFVASAAVLVLEILGIRLLGPYVGLTWLGSAIWCFAFAGAGWAAGANWEHFHDAFRYVDYLVAAAVVAAAAWLAWRYVRRRRQPVDEPA